MKEKSANSFEIVLGADTIADSRSKGVLVHMWKLWFSLIWKVSKRDFCAYTRAGCATDHICVVVCAHTNMWTKDELPRFDGTMLARIVRQLSRCAATPVPFFYNTVVREAANERPPI